MRKQNFPHPEIRPSPPAAKAHEPAGTAIPLSNRLIAALPRRDRARLLARCDHVNLVRGDVVGEPGNRVQYAYFPISSFISLIAPADGAASLEVGMVGDEGMHGISLALGIDHSPLHSLVQGGRPVPAPQRGIVQARARAKPRIATPAESIPVRAHEPARAVCRLRPVPFLIEARLARWLLMTGDRAHTDFFHITHEFLAWMLGVRRVGVTNAAGALQKRNLIAYVRGKVTILNRRGLEAVSCACYQVDKGVYRRFLG